VGGAPGREHPLVASVTVIGRGAEADLRLADTGVSRAHAEVLLDGPEVRLTDLGSTNGTLVNGRRISAAVLVDGDRIEVGATPLVFRREG
jgi:pSer/pThr/pTyr-binding forkhead associated (FHA) protein